MSSPHISSMALSEGAEFKSSKGNLKKYLYGTIAVIIALLVLAIVFIVLYAEKDSNSDSDSNSQFNRNNQMTERPTSTATPTPSHTTRTTERKCLYPSTSPPTPGGNTDGPYTTAAVAADDYRCSDVGAKILKRNGSAVDAAIASLFCLGVINMHSTGIGGGAFMVVYSRQNRTAEYFNFRERAPGRATENMYVNKSDASKTGGLAIAVPGEVRGMYEAWKKYGKLEWKLLVEPAIKLARDGFIIHRALDFAIKTREDDIHELEGMRELLVKEDGCLKRLGDRLKNPKLAITLERISYDPMSFYEGRLAEDIINDISSQGGIITSEDLKNYTVQIESAINSSVGEHRLFTTGLPSSGVLVTFMLNVLKGFKFSPKDDANDKATSAAYHKIIETFKYAYARRALLGDKDYANVSEIYNDLADSAYAEKIRMNISNNLTYHNASHYGGYYSNYDAPGTSHLSVLAPNGDAVSVTSTVNTYFGSKIRSTVTGIVYNNQMDDFSTPGLTNSYGVEPSPSNFIRPGKRPMSSMSPVIFTNRTTGDVALIVGASGGTRITTGTVLAAIYKLWFGRNTSEAVIDPRFHHQLFPNITAIEKAPYNLADQTVDKLRQYGHNVEERNFYCVVQAVSKENNGEIYAKSDPRKGGYPAGF